MPRSFLIACLLAAAAGACSKRDPVDDKALRNTAGLPVANQTEPSADGAPRGEETTPAKPLPDAAAAIPAALQGRWGLTPQDCVPGRSDAKGLLTITPDELRFYESRAVPAGDIQRQSDSISGTFAFTGEGQSWSKFEVLQLQDQGLVRTETNPAASFTYAKCT